MDEVSDDGGLEDSVSAAGPIEGPLLAAGVKEAQGEAARGEGGEGDPVNVGCPVEEPFAFWRWPGTRPIRRSRSGTRAAAGS